MPLYHYAMFLMKKKTKVRGQTVIPLNVVDAKPRTEPRTSATVRGVDECQGTLRWEREEFKGYIYIYILHTHTKVGARRVQGCGGVGQRRVRVLGLSQCSCVCLLLLLGFEGLH